MILLAESQITKDHNVITMTELQAIFIQVYISYIGLFIILPFARSVLEQLKKYYVSRIDAILSKRTLKTTSHSMQSVTEHCEQL